MNKRFVLLSAISLFLVSCVSVNNQAIPAWFVNQYDSSYNENNYICAVGSGDSKEEAHENAKIALSQVFNTQIKNATILYDSDKTSSLDSIGYVDTAVEDLIGLKVVNTFVNKDGVFFVRVALEKRLAINKLREIITPKNAEITSLLIANNISDLTYLQNLLQARKKAIALQQYFDQLTVLEGKTVVSPLIAVDNKIMIVKQSLTLNVQVESEDSSINSQLKKAAETMLLNKGISINSNGPTLSISYDSSPAPPKNKLYQCNFNLKIQVIEDLTTVISMEKQGRAIGISEENAQAKAIKNAIAFIEGELFE